MPRVTVESPLLKIGDTEPVIRRAILSHGNVGRRLSGGPFQPGEQRVFELSAVCLSQESQQMALK